MLIESLLRLSSLDFQWFLDLLFNNLLIFFLLFATFYIFLEGQSVIKGSLVIFITFFAFFDFETVMGVSVFTGSFLIVYYITKIAVIAIVEQSKSLKPYLIFINELQFFAAIVILLLFFV